jgi:hypothetical protein
MKRRAPQGGKVSDLAWRRERARLAVEARMEQAERRRARIGARFKTKAEAFAAGDRNGYSRAMRWWKFQVKSGRVDASGRNTKKAVA